MAATVFAACNNKPKFMVEGQIENAADAVLYLEENTLDGIQVLDSLRLKADGDFRFHVTAPADCPSFYMLRVGGERICFAVDSTETITVEAAVPDMGRNYTVEGNVSSQKMKESPWCSKICKRRLWHGKRMKICILATSPTA